MKDQWAQRILAISLGCSALLLSASLFVATTGWSGRLQANEWQPDAKTATWDDNLRGAVGLGIHDNFAYFVIWSQPNQFYKVELSKARNWYDD
jgi:hypothetical protein